MTRTDHKVLFTALGFMAVVLQDVPLDKQALRATVVARLIESFCVTALPDAFEFINLGDAGHAVEINPLIERYKADFVNEESASLSFDRETLLKMYDQLLLRQAHLKNREFYASCSDDLIANRIRQMVEEEINHEERSA